ncbi:MAG: hypothetical protein GY842_18385 [bacterium]|nr:hypothetical protein [bacterium]
MSLIRVAKPDEIHPTQVVTAILVLLTLTGSCLLYSGARSPNLPDGAREWSADSLLRPLVANLNLDYAHPTPAGSDIKTLVFGIGTALAVLSVGVALVCRPRGGGEVSEDDTIITEPLAQGELEQPSRRQITPAVAAQLMMVVLVGWSFASITWADAREHALYGSLQLAVYTLWPLALAYGLNRGTARFGAYALVLAGAATGCVAVWYHLERNPTLRASFPIGNPTFLASCLIPCLLVAGCVLVGQVRDFGNPRRMRRVVLALLCALVLTVMWSAFTRADSRGGWAGLAAGVVALAFFAMGRRGKLVVTLLAVGVAAVAAWKVLPAMSAPSPTGRDVSFRVRGYSWSYALGLIDQHKLLGHGQGAYTCKADALASGEDALADPEALSARIAHAHNEWLEVWAELGSVGLVLTIGALLLTLCAGAVAIRSLHSITARWVLTGLLGALVGLIVAELSGVGLRGTGLPPIYYTVIGVIWAFARVEGCGSGNAWYRRSLVRSGAALGITVLAIGSAYICVRDFQAARADFEASRAMEDLDWERALPLSKTARSYRLSPQRRLEAQSRQVAHYLHIGNTHLASGRRRAATALQSTPIDRELLTIADQDLAIVQSCRLRGTESLQELVRAAPGLYNSSWQEYGFERIRAEIARMRGAPDAQQYSRNAATALAREIARRPYNTNLAARYVMIGIPDVLPAEIIQVLARPLRMNRMPVGYHQLIARLLSIPAFKSGVIPIHARASAADPNVAPAEWEDPFAPETLRLTAAIWVEDGAYDLAVQTLEQACTLYEGLRPRFAYATAGCRSELAEILFVDDPTNPARAIEQAQAAIDCAPPSYEGRLLVEMLGRSMVSMHLAAGDESSAKDALLAVVPDEDPDRMGAFLSARYTDLVAILMRSEGETPADPMRRWNDRALELDPDNELAWRQSADLALREGDDAECVRCLREARLRGAADELIFRFVDLALRRNPTSAALREYAGKLGAEITANRPESATNPAVSSPGPRQP